MGPSGPEGQPARGSTRRLALSERAAVVTLLVLVFTGVLAFGASDIGMAVLLASLYAFYLAGLLATCAWARRDLVRLKGGKVSAFLFVVLILAVLWALTPWGPGGAHPVWAYLPGDAGSLALDRSALLLNVVQLFGLACLLLAGRVLGASETRARWFLRAAVFAAGLYAAAAFLDHVTTRRATRLAATLLSSNSAATMFGSALLLAMALLTHRLRRDLGLRSLWRGDPMTILAAGTVAALAITLLLTASRGGLAATFIAASFFLVGEGLARRQRLRSSVVLGVVAAICLVAALTLRSADGVAERLSGVEHDAGIRTAIFAPHWEAFLTSPWSGFGLGSFPTINQLVMNRENLPFLFDVRAVHNLYLQWLEEAGVVGAVAMALLFVSLVWPILRRGFRGGTASLWCRATICACILFLVHGVTDFALQVPAIQALAALILGVVGGMAADRRDGRAALKAPQWPVGVAAGSAATVGLVAALVAVPLIVSKFGGDLSAWPTASAEVLGRAIETRLGRPPSSQDDLHRLVRLSDRELAMRPASGAAWLRRSSVETALGHETLANQALERSFSVAPLQSSLFVRRTVLAYERWDRLSPAAREQTIYQVGAEWRRRRGWIWPRQFVAMANGLKNPAGRVGLALQIAVLRLEAPPAN